MKYMICILMMLGAASVYAEAPITAMAIAPNHKQVLMGSQLGIEIRSLPELNVIGSLATKLEHVHDLKFSPNGESLLAAGGSPAESGGVEVWNWPPRERVQEVGGHDDVVYCVTWSADGTQWVACSGDGRCSVISAASGKRVTLYEGHSRGVLSCVYLDGQTVASAGIDQTIRLWSCLDGTHQRTLDNHVGTVNDLAIRPASNSQPPDVVASISEDRTVRLWQPRIGRLMRFARLASVPRSFVWTNDGTKLYVGCNDGRIRIIDAESMEVEAEFDGLVGRIHELIVEPVSGYIVTAGERGCRVIPSDAK